MRYDGLADVADNRDAEPISIAHVERDFESITAATCQHDIARHDSIALLVTHALPQMIWRLGI